MTTTALERVRGLANLAVDAPWDAVGNTVTAHHAASDDRLQYFICDDVNGDRTRKAFKRRPTDNAAFIAAACNYVRSDEFDALVRDAMAWRAVTGGEVLDQAIDAERGGG